ncbi:hypothetical protein DAPPUDRAFT_235433 [Daphnia pulex]|uniref:Uncharacterized protein n=1 Tax=Daphnia pulex TaxID=6669 RepID=E9FYZ4_DAPPU|nr:hypothetical protein DAPPUDRAFT_235433 [Daphnia pulex]|eukprot:EFX87685.1 hypothetical protein DAPPUDRAFT_235433 [Daphnia pulex]
MADIGRRQQPTTATLASSTVHSELQWRSEEEEDDSEEHTEDSASSSSDEREPLHIETAAQQQQQQCSYLATSSESQPFSSNHIGGVTPNHPDFLYNLNSLPKDFWVPNETPTFTTHLDRPLHFTFKFAELCDPDRYAEQGYHSQHQPRHLNHLNMSEDDFEGMYNNCGEELYEADPHGLPQQHRQPHNSGGTTGQRLNNGQHPNRRSTKTQHIGSSPRSTGAAMGSRSGRGQQQQPHQHHHHHHQQPPPLPAGGLASQQQPQDLMMNSPQHQHHQRSGRGGGRLPVGSKSPSASSQQSDPIYPLDAGMEPYSTLSAKQPPYIWGMRDDVRFRIKYYRTAEMLYVITSGCRNRVGLDYGGYVTFSRWEMEERIPLVFCFLSSFVTGPVSSVKNRSNSPAAPCDLCLVEGNNEANVRMCIKNLCRPLNWQVQHCIMQEETGDYAQESGILLMFGRKGKHGQFFDNIYQRYSPCLLARSTGFSFPLAFFLYTSTTLFGEEGGGGPCVYRGQIASVVVCVVQLLWASRKEEEEEALRGFYSLGSNRTEMDAKLAGLFVQIAAGARKRTPTSGIVYIFVSFLLVLGDREVRRLQTRSVGSAGGRDCRTLDDGGDHDHHGTPPPAPAPGNGMGAPPPPPDFPPRGSSFNHPSLIALQGQQQPMQQQRAATLVVTKDNSDEPPTYELCKEQSKSRARAAASESKVAKVCAGCQVDVYYTETGPALQLCIGLFLSVAPSLNDTPITF